MSKAEDRIEREAAAERLKQARINAGFKGTLTASKAHGWNHNSYKAHESAKNGFGIADARAYAKAFGCSLTWLTLGLGNMNDRDDPKSIAIRDVPLVSWVSAGQMAEGETILEVDDFQTVSTIDLPDGDWIALRVEGNSMNKISPPGSIIFANRKDRRLVPNGLYVIADETGAATYKRYRPNDNPPFQPASYDDVAPPALSGAVHVIGRVRRSVIDA